MRFLECYIDNFGKLQGFRYQFDGGLNTILAENGYGKTTLSAFLKCMLYGMEDTKRQDLSENDRKHYMPWQGGRCGGYLTIEYEGRRYRIERSFAPKAADDTFALYDLESGCVSDDYTSMLGEEMLGIDRDGFERTLFLSERRLSGKNDNKSISARLSELVGCDGDIGGVDSAMKRLEEKRKYYKKTGGRGYIDELAASISVCSQSILALERAHEGSRDLEIMLAEQKNEILSIEKGLSELEKEREELRLKKSKQALTDQYNDMLKRIEHDTSRLREIRECFGESVPTAEEIDGAVYKLREAERLGALTEEGETDREFISLRAKFDGKCTLSEIEMASASAERVEACKRELDALVGIGNANSKYFSKRIPERGELTEAMKDNRGLMIPGAVALIATIPFMFLSIYVGIATAVLGSILFAVAFGISVRKSRRTDRLLSELSDEPLPRRSERRAYLRMLVDILDEETKKQAEYIEAQKRREDLTTEISERERSLFALLSSTGYPTDDPTSRIADLRSDFIRYYQLSLSFAKEQEARGRAAIQIADLRREVAEFLGRFGELGDSPFDRLKSMLSEYTLLSSSIADREGECASLRERYGINGSDVGYNPERMLAVEAKIRESSEHLQARRREYTAGELRLASESESYERVYELKGRMTELSARKEAAENDLDSVLGAKKFINAAMESLTAKYLGKTREGFAKYRNMIDCDSERDFLMDTSFSLSVADGGATHPEEAYSRGTRDLYAIAMRLALSDALYVGELPPIILDDPFAALDDERLARALALIKQVAGERQVIYLTCQKSRKPT